MSEDNSHKRTKVIRNPRGSKHAMASVNSSYSRNASDEVSALLLAATDIEVRRIL